MNAKVTVCIPAYQAASFLAETIHSVLRQSFTDFIVTIGVDPAENAKDDETHRVASRFTSDPRVTVFKNKTRLGWTGNIAKLIESVDTEFYAILPHDDVWEQEYIEQLMTALASDDQAIVAYSDVLACNSFTQGGIWSLHLPRQEDQASHFLRLLASGRALLWRGLTKSAARRFIHGFAPNQGTGFAQENEYALSLLLSGRAVHVPVALYKKTLHNKRSDSASFQRAHTSLQDRVGRWLDYMRQLKQISEIAKERIPRLVEESAICDLAALISSAKMHQLFFGGQLPHNISNRLSKALGETKDDDDPVRAFVLGQCRQVLLNDGAFKTDGPYAVKNL